MEIDTAAGPFEADHVICATGFRIASTRAPLLAGFGHRVATWADRHLTAGAEDPRLASYPYLGDIFQLLAKEGDDAGLSRIRLMTFGATMSFGPSGSSINALRFAAPRLVHGITRDLFAEGAEEHLDVLSTYDTPEF